MALHDWMQSSAVRKMAGHDVMQAFIVHKIAGNDEMQAAGVLEMAGFRGKWSKTVNICHCSQIMVTCACGQPVIFRRTIMQQLFAGGLQPGIFRAFQQFPVASNWQDDGEADDDERIHRLTVKSVSATALASRRRTTMKIPDIKEQEPLAVEAGVSKLARVEFARHPFPALLKEPAHFWDEIFIANEAYVLGEVTHPRIRRKLAYDAATRRLFLEYIEGATLQELVQAGLPARIRAGRIVCCKAWRKRWRTCTRASFADARSSTMI